MSDVDRMVTAVSLSYWVISDKEEEEEGGLTKSNDYRSVNLTY